MSACCPATPTPTCRRASTPIWRAPGLTGPRTITVTSVPQATGAGTFTARSVIVNYTYQFVVLGADRLGIRRQLRHDSASRGVSDANRSGRRHPKGEVMKKQHRTLIVVVVAVLTAALASFGMYRAVQRLGVREVEVAHMQVVVAAQTLTMGTRLHRKPSSSRRLAVPQSGAGAFADPKKLVDRGVIVPIAENEPITENKVASLEAGAGLPPVIPEGMRAISVRVNEVIGVAGFVVPGTLVDVLVTVRQRRNEEPMTRTVVSKVQVLTAGTSSTRRSRRTASRFRPRS